MNDIFHKIATKVATWTGSSGAFLLALTIVLAWGVSGPIFHFSNTWQLVINTGTTIVTFLMVFLIQNTQNRDGKAVQLKLDELIRASKAARDNFLNIEDLSDDELAELDKEFHRIHELYNNQPPASLHKLHKHILAVTEHRGKDKKSST
jgi:low affinity Fe/Cu permease